MANYRFQVRTQRGEVQVGVMAAENAGAAAAILRAQGQHVMSLNPVQVAEQEKGMGDLLKRLNAGRAKQKHVLDFTTQLAVMIRAGINIRAALDGIADQTEHPSFKKIIQGLKNDVEAGKQFS